MATVVHDQEVIGRDALDALMRRLLTDLLVCDVTPVYTGKHYTCLASYERVYTVYWREKGR